MPQGRVAGSVDLRPIRLGLLVEHDSRPSLRRAIEHASLWWGGESFPIFSADEDVETVQRTATLLGIDALVACDDDPRARELADTAGFAWAGIRDAPGFDEGADELVDLQTILNSLETRPAARPELPKLVEWSQEDPLADLFSVMWGRLSSGTKYQEVVSAVVARSLTSAPVPIDADIPEAIERTDGVLELGMWEVSHRAVHVETGIVVVDPTSFSDLLMYWNLRAAGNLVLPWVDPEFDPRIAQFLERKLDRLPRARWGEESEPELSVFSSVREIPEHLLPILERDKSRKIISLTNVASQMLLGSQIMTDFSATFDAAVEPRFGGSVQVPVPRTDLVPVRRAERPPSALGWQYCAARVNIWSETDLPEQSTFRAPAIRRLAPSIRFAVSVTAPVVRGVGEGVVVATRLDEPSLSLGSVESPQLMVRLLRDAGFEVRFSDASRWSGRIIDLLGGAASTLASQPAAREVLGLASRERGASVKELYAVARQHQKPWNEEMQFRHREEPYHRWVVAVLAARRIIEPFLDYRCPACGLRQSLVAEQVSAVLACDACEKETPLALQVVSGASWRLRTRRLIDTNKLRSVLPVAATLRLLGELDQRNQSLHYALGLELERDSTRFEIDLAAIVHDNRGPAVVLGECKARVSIDDADIDNLEMVQTAVRVLGIECFIAVSTSKEQLSDGEVARLRRSADRLVYGIADGYGRGGYLNLPVVLTRQPLTTPERHADHPFQSADMRFARELARLADWTCRRELGLQGYTDRTISWASRRH